MNLDLVHRLGDGDSLIAIGIVDQNHQIHEGLRHEFFGDATILSESLERRILRFVCTKTDCGSVVISSCPKLVTLCAVK